MPPWQTLGQMFEANARRLPDRIAVIDGDQQITYAELHREARALAKAHDRRRRRPWRPRRLLGAKWLALGGDGPRGLDDRQRDRADLQPAESAGGRADPGADRRKILFTVGECAGNHFIAMLREAYGDDLEGHLCRRLPGGWFGSTRIRRKTRKTAPAIGRFHRQPGESIGEAVIARLHAIAAVQPGDICEIIFTSGTTGTPKGVQLTHAQLMRAYWDWSGIGGLTSDDNYLVITPFSHGFGLNAGVIASALRGMCMVLLDIFEPKAALELIRRHRISVIGGPPNLFTRLMDQPGVAENPPTSLRVAFLGAASVPVEILRRVGSVLGIRRVINAYGLMEGCVVSMTRADDDPSVISTTTGRALPDVEVWVVDDAGQPVAAGEAGEILVRGYGVMAGYWRDEAQTWASITDGWFHTGDIGIRDAAGNISIVDRKKDMFICGGFNAYPAEIEDLLLKIGSLSAVSVVGVPDPQRGESAVAFVVPSSGHQVDESSVIAWARQNLAGYKVPRRVFVRDSLPLNPNGKVMKDALRREAADSLIPDAVAGR